MKSRQQTLFLVVFINTRFSPVFCLFFFHHRACGELGVHIAVHVDVGAFIHVCMNTHILCFIFLSFVFFFSARASLFDTHLFLLLSFSAQLKYFYYFKFWCLFVFAISMHK